MRADERGAVAFVRPRAHIYKLLLSGGIPEEVIVDGPYVYTNGNVQAAMNDTTVKPWTRLDTRRLTARQQQSNGDELAHVRAPAYLIEGVAHLRRVGVGSGGVVHVRGVVDPARLAAHVPPSIRASILAAVARDYTRRPFPADFWIDPKGRVRRVHVSYRTGSSGRIVVTATYSDFGAPVALGLPRLVAHAGHHAVAQLPREPAASTRSSDGAASWSSPIASAAHPRTLKGRRNADSSRRTASSSQSSGGSGRATAGET